MSTAVWPPIATGQLCKEEDQSLAQELLWLLDSLQETLKSLKAGFEECRLLLAPTENGSTLVLSSHRSEAVKGFVTRNGTRIIKGNIKLRLSSLPPPKGAPSFPLVISTAPHAPTLILDELTATHTLINACLDIVDASIWGGDPKDPHFIAGQLRLLDINIQEAKQVLKGGDDRHSSWCQDPVDEDVFDPPLPPTLSFHLSIYEAGLLLEVRTLEPASAARQYSNLSFREQLAVALGGPRPPLHDEADETFTYKEQEVRVREKVRVESQDPSLMAALVKLNALERTVGLALKALDILMGKEND